MKPETTVSCWCHMHLIKSWCWCIIYNRNHSTAFKQLLNHYLIASHLQRTMKGYGHLNDFIEALCNDTLYTRQQTNTTEQIVTKEIISPPAGRWNTTVMAPATVILLSPCYHHTATTLLSSHCYRPATIIHHTSYTSKRQTQEWTRSTMEAITGVDYICNRSQHRRWLFLQ